MDFIRTIKAEEEATAKELMGWLTYQVCNGGVHQYCYNGYADELLSYAETRDIVKELTEQGCPQEGIQAMSKMLKMLSTSYPYESCPECGGSGYFDETCYEEDGEHEVGDSYEVECEHCHGDGEIEPENWSETDNLPWMDEFDNWFYSLNLDALDDWTNQSHNHSVMLDVIEQNKNK